MEDVLRRSDEMFKHLVAQDGIGVRVGGPTFCGKEQVLSLGYCRGCELWPHSNRWLSLKHPSAACGYCQASLRALSSCLWPIAFSLFQRGIFLGRMCWDQWAWLAEDPDLKFLWDWCSFCSLHSAMQLWSVPYFGHLDIWLLLGTTNEVFVEGAEIFLDQGCKNH